MSNEKVKRNVKKNSFWSLIKQDGKMDLTFFFLVMGLLVIGLVMLFSASAPYASNYNSSSYHYIKRQLVFAIGGVILMIVISKINYHLIKKLVWVITIAAVIMLLLVLILPSTKEGFHRWLNLGFIQFQPSEFGKFALVVLLSHIISDNHKMMGKSYKLQFKLIGIIIAFCVLVIAEKHLSATLIIFAIGVVLMVVGGMNLKLFCGLSISGAILGLIAIFSGLISYASDRIKFWRDPWLAPLKEGYQTIQSLLAIGSGGIMGRGLGQSNQKYLWLPEPQNDFIFSVVCEELGLVGATLIVIAFALLVWRGFTIALRAPDKFGALLTIGLTFQVGLQAVLNILVVTKTIPNTGISLPFFSYGGTSLIMLLIQMGIILSVSRSSNLEKA